MTTRQITERLSLHPLCHGSPVQITSVYCCDLLSLAMVRAPKGCCWVTVIASPNTIAVAKHTQAACVLLAEGVPASEEMRRAAEEHGIPLFTTDLPIFAAAKAVDALL